VVDAEVELPGRAAPPAVVLGAKFDFRLALAKATPPVP
jgi:hypothetical protein